MHPNGDSAARAPWPAADPHLSIVEALDRTQLPALTGGRRRHAVRSLARYDPGARPGGEGWCVPVLRRRDRVFVAALVGLWLVLVACFWLWWLRPAHVVTPFGIALNTAVLLYVSTLPLMYVCAVLRLRKVNPAIAVPDLRVAMVVTKAPAEPWAVVERTLRAMLAQRYPHSYDVWLCDESPDETARQWCADHGVRISTRYGADEYHRASWPRRTKCKEGNLAYFYDHWGYREYDVVAQLDADHVPAPGYLAEVVRPFANPDVGYVAAPSVCDANAAGSWSARGRLYREATFHGPVQAGANDGWAPVCIGSHYAVRTRALRDIGGVGPELAEDFTTSYLLNVAGWSGSFALDADARGDGPETVGAMAVQEFQWARSLFSVLLDLVPPTIRRLPWTLRLRFGFALLYYPSLVLTTLVGIVLPPIACLRGEAWVNVNYVHFLAGWLLPPFALIAVTLLMRRRRTLRPRQTKVFGWELWLYVFCRWVFVAWGLAAAVVQKVRPRRITFKVTPKDRGLEPLPGRLLVPFAAISAFSAAGHVVGLKNPDTVGYALLSLLGAVVYTAVALACTVLHVHEARRATGAPWRRALSTVSTAVPIVLGQLALLAIAVSWALAPWIAGAT